MSEAPPSLPGVLSRPDAQIIVDALNKRLWEAEKAIAGIKAPEAWNAVTFLNSWANFEAAGTNMTAGYRKASDGRVTLRGLVKHEGSLTGLVGSTIFTLPESFRPSKNLVFPSVFASGSLITATTSIASNGEVSFVPNSTAVISYTPINFSFYAD